MKINTAARVARNQSPIYIIDDINQVPQLPIPDDEREIAIAHLKKELKEVVLPETNRLISIILVDKKKEDYKTAENLRKSGYNLLSALNRSKFSSVFIENRSQISNAALSVAEGMALGNYQFLRFKKDREKEANSLKEITLHAAQCNSKEVETLQAVVDSVYLVRDLVNLPVNYLNAVGLAQEIVKVGKQAGFRTEVFSKSKIEALKMGGLLAVNQGSVDPPSFSIMEYQPRKAVNKQPIVLVGKGIVYDTGGLSLKPTPNSMDYMKCDMAGAAVVLGVISCAARTKLPVHLIGLVPATDNRPGFNAFAPGDIITMHNQMTVEMLNSDAEGRMILGDALSFARQYKPELLIDIATLTGAAHRALGDQAFALMRTASDEVMALMHKASQDTYERFVEFPLWEEYGEWLKSDIADIKNVGGVNAGMITAGKFLEKFIDYPWVHMDIAGVAFLSSASSYRGKHASGIGVRFLYRFLQLRAAQPS
ncbi:MAG: leucyl aminopeptidase [Chitinophagales bacterium]|nr:leucyl aminopeptidase [Chitinophagales bacterium]MDW8428000.1 leucyl aminopeptidase [Chitinophagales bacterium]